MAAEEANNEEFLKWKLLPASISDEFQPDPLTGEQYIRLAKAINRPKYMLKLLHQMLFKNNALLGDQNKCAQYLLQYFDSEQGQNQNKKKLDPHTYFAEKFSGMKSFPSEALESMKGKYGETGTSKTEFACMKHIVKVDPMLMRLSLKPSPQGQMVRKVIDDEDLQNIIVHFAGKQWVSYFEQTIKSSAGLSKSEAIKEVREKDLAFLPLKDWRQEHYDAAKQPYVFATGVLVTEIKEAMSSLGFKQRTHEKYITKLQEVTEMDVSNDDNVAAKLAMEQQLEKHEWKTLMEAAVNKMKKFVDFGNGFIFCPSEEGVNSSWDDVSYEDLSTHVGVLFAKMQSKRIFAQAGYQTTSSDGNSQKDIEYGAANAKETDLHWDKSQQKAREGKLTGVSSQIGQAMYSNMLVSLHIRPHTPVHEAVNELYHEARRVALKRRDVGDPRCMTTISFCSGTLAFLQGVGMEWRVVHMIDKILSTAQNNGHPE